MSVKLAFQMLVFNSDYVLRPCLEAIVDHGPVFVTEGPVDFWMRRGYSISTDDTNSILEEFVPKDRIVHGQWPEKDEMQNAVVHLIPDDITHVWLVDSDEVWSPDDIATVKGWLESGVDSVSFKFFALYGGFDRYVTGFEENFETTRIQRWHPGARWKTHRPPTILAPDKRPWREHSHMDHEATDAKGVRCRHYSYLFPSQMAMKDAYYAERTGSMHIPDYMRRVYLPWVVGDDAAKAKVEKEFMGVHDWKPQFRGPAFTAPFTAGHPPTIAKCLPELRERFDRELEALKTLV